MKFLYSLLFYFLSGFVVLFGQASPGCKVIYLEHENASSGEQVCIDIKVKDFQQMLGAQFTLKWDTAMLEFSGLENFNLPNLASSNFGTTPGILAQGRLTFLWFFISLDEEGVSLPDDATIFTACFNVKGPSGSFAPIYFDQAPTSTELTGWPGPQAFDNFLTIGGGVFIGDFPPTTPLELLSACSFSQSCDSTSSYTADLSGGTPPYNFEWKSGNSIVSNTADILFSGKGRYQLKVTDANQQALFVELSSADNTLKVAASLTKTACDEHTGAIDLNVSGGSGQYGYTWSDNSSEADRTNLSAGIYGLTLTDELTGCALTREFEITTDSCSLEETSLVIPFATVEPNGAVCVDVNGKGLSAIKGFDITFSWDTSVVRLDKVVLLQLPGEENDVINYNEDGNTFSISRRYDQPIRFEEGATLFSPCFISVAQAGYSDIVFENIQTQIIGENDSILTPDLQNGKIWTRSTDSLKIRIEAAGANPEDRVCVAVSSENYTDITAIQYSLTWYESILEFEGIEDGVLSIGDSTGVISWLIDENQRGILTFFGRTPEGTTINDGDVHYRICFTAKRGGVGDITMASDPFLSEAFNKVDQYVPIEIIPGLVVIGEVPPQPMLRIGDNRGQVGEEICVPFTGEQFAGVQKMDLTMTWDTSIIQLRTINEGNVPAFALSTWELNQEVEGTLNVSWQNDSFPEYFFRPQTLLELCFLGIEEGVSQVEINPSLIFVSDNFNADPMLLPGQIEVVSQDTFSDQIILTMPDLTAAEGQSICVPVYAYDFNNMAGMQYTHHWDTTVLKLENVLIGDLPDLGQGNFGFTIGKGNLPVSWTYSRTGEGVSLADSTVLYSLCFTVIGETGAVGDLWIDGNPVPTEIVKVVDSDLILVGLTVEPGSVSISRNFVWPGDTDHNGITNHQDLLNIGLAFGQEGPERVPENNLNWEPLSATDWTDSTPQTLTNYKHIDADGNGRIEAADTLAIVNNWNKTTPWYEAPVDEGIVRFEPQQGAPLFVVAREEVRIGKNTFDVILGTEADPAEEVYGLAFSIFYNYEGIQSEKVYAGFDSTWLGIVGDNLLTLQRNDPAQNRIDIAITRTDGLNMSGKGAIASLHVTIEDIILLEGNEDLIDFRIERVRVINALEVDRPTVPTPTSMTVTQQTTPTFDLLDQRFIHLYPNPTRGQLNIEARGIIPERMSVLTAQGTIMIRRSFDKTLLLNDLEPGVYFLKLEARGQSVIKPFVIIH